MGQEQLVFIHIPEDEGIYGRGLVVNTRDECPTCSPTQVDVLSFDAEALPTYNLEGTKTRVYIWAAVR